MKNINKKGNDNALGIFIFLLILGGTWLGGYLLGYHPLEIIKGLF